MPRFLDRAILLKRWAYGESSLVVHCATREHGRVHLLARGAYRTTSRYFAALDLFDELEIEWQQSPRRELGELRAASILARRRAPTRSLEAYRAALTVLELADLASRPAQPDPELYDLVARALDALERDPGAAELALVVFELAFLQNLGLDPALERCAACARRAGPVGGDGLRVAFSAGAGGRLCAACAADARAAGRRVGTMPLEVLEDARALSPGGPRRQARASAAREDALGTLLPAADLTPGRLERVRDFVGRFLDYHLEARPRMHRAFLAVPNRNAPRPAADAP